LGVHDMGYKLIFSHPQMIRDLLLGFVKEDWVEQLDFESLERQNGSYVSDDFAEREDDIIWRVKWIGEDRWMYIYLLIEFQTDADRHMALRMMNYVSCLYQDLVKTESFKGMLPPVLPMVIYRGDSQWKKALDISELIESAPGSLKKYQPQMTYLLLEERKVDDKTLNSMQNLVAGIIKIEKEKNVMKALKAFYTLINWLSEPGAKQQSLKRAVSAWFRKAQEPVKLLADVTLEELTFEEVEPMFAERMEQLKRDLVREGMEEGMEKGMEKGEALIIAKLLAHKFGPLSPEVKQTISNADSSTLLKWSERILTAESLDEIFTSGQPDSIDNDSDLTE
jgi:predicted transposase/invertase (TIGR01784 family)